MGPRGSLEDLATEICLLLVRIRTRSCSYPTPALLQKYAFLYNHKIKQIRSLARLLLLPSNTLKV